MVADDDSDAEPPSDPEHTSTGTTAGGGKELEEARKLEEKRKLEEERKKRQACKVGRMLRDDIKNWRPWRNSLRGRDKAQDLDVPMQEPASYIRGAFPPTLAIFLVALCGMHALLGEVSQGGSTQPPRVVMRGVLFVYMIGTMLGKFVIGETFMPPHFLKVSQTLKMRGVGSRAMGFLSALGICASDRTRWQREEYLRREKDEDLMTKDLNKAISVAWDNNDTDATARFESAVHNGNIGATGHEQLEASDDPLILGPEKDWLPKEDLDLETLLKGRHPEAHDKTIKEWHDLLHATLVDSPFYLGSKGEDRSCLEAKLREVVPTAPVSVKSKNLFVQPGSTKHQEDNEAALARIQLICHADIKWVKDPDTGDLISEILRRVLVEGDQEIFGFMVDAKRGNPEKFKWLLPHPGGWHILLHLSRALLFRYWGAGVERIAQELGGDDRHAAAGSNYRRSHHFLTVTYEALWRVIIDLYVEERNEEEGAVHPDQRTVDMGRDVIPWLLKRAESHKTLKFWTQFLLEDYPAYLAFRTGGRTGNYELCVAALRVLAHLFAATGKINYQHLIIEHLTNLARMTDKDRETIGSLFTSSYSGKEFTHVFLDEFQEMANRDVKSALGRITQAFMAKLAAICDARAKAARSFDEFLGPDLKERDVTRGLIRDRAGGVAKVIPWLRTSLAFSPEGAERLRSLAGAVATKDDEEVMLDGDAIAKTWFKETLTHHVLREEGGHPVARRKLPRFPALNDTHRATVPTKKKRAQRKALKDMTVQASEWWGVLKDVVGRLASGANVGVTAIKQGIGAVLPMALSHTGDGGGRVAKKSEGLNTFVKKYCADAFQPSRFYPVEGTAVDMATELHRPPSKATLAKGTRAVVQHFKRQVGVFGVSFGAGVDHTLCLRCVKPVMYLTHTHRLFVEGSCVLLYFHVVHAVFLFKLFFSTKALLINTR